MKVSTATIEELFDQLRQRFQKDHITREDVNERPPLRSEILSADQMDNHARQLASKHTLTNQPAAERLLNRLAENEEILFRVTQLLQSAINEKKTVTPAGEWLLDNFYLIEEQIRIGKRHLPKGYSKGLPRLANGKATGFPRVYDIATEIISHSDGHVDINSLSGFIHAYQQVNYLTLGELWAVPIMLRLALLENLSRVAARIAIDRLDEDLANFWAERILEVAEKDPKNLVLVIADMSRSNPPMVSAFVAAFTRKLQWKGPDLTLPISWVEQHLSDSDVTINSMVLAENQKQAADQVSMSNSISSLRFLAKMDWREFVESMSAVEQSLRLDPAGVYPNMDFNTRDQYRHVVERIAKKCHRDEHTIASMVITLAKEKVSDNGSSRKTHVGYYLIGPGIRQLKQQVKPHSTIGQSMGEYCTRNARTFYTLGAFAITLLLTASLLYKAITDEVSARWIVGSAVLLLLVTSQFALSIVNWIATLRVKPARLPKMNFSTGVPNEFRTLVVVPTLLTSPKQVLSLLEDIEVRFLANRDPNVVFGLLTDFKDSAQQIQTGDNELVDIVQRGIGELNVKYGRVLDDTFFLFHRPRVWNASEKTWMGHERKRGKLSDLNQLLRGGARDNFSVIVGEFSVLRAIKYVITLDTDTQLPRNAAWKLVGIMAHPLNQPVYDEDRQRVTEGYGIIQPRIAVSLHGAERTRYTRMHENDSGIDPYTNAVSDVYQDVFEEGSFIGKGIYDVDVFEKALHNRFPDNRILSHDLLEGSYVRCGYASDVQFYEDYPSQYNVDISRRHRWVRGDWQIWNWFLPVVPDKRGDLHRNPVSSLSRWKIFDNLRRSLVSVALIALFVIAWFAMPSPIFWTLCTLGIIVVPSLLMSLYSMTRKPSEVLWWHHLINVGRNTYRTILQALFTLICLPYEAFIHADAIVRTLWRMFVSGKKLLQWNPSAFAQSTRDSLVGIYIRMITSPLFSLLVGYLLYKFHPETLLLASPFLITWLLAPAVVWWLNKPLPSLTRELNTDQKDTLRELSRKTWAFFEDLVGPSDNWLPPDNLQEYPIQIVAHRTSPTNIGLALLANLTALDFGFSTITTFIDRTTNTFGTLKKLERYQGHFYNWYDTQNLQTLHPRYVSTVDSGNLAGHLLTLRQGIFQMRSRVVADRCMVEGLYDTVRIIFDKFPAGGDTRWENAKKDIAEVLMLSQITPRDIKSLTEQLLEHCQHSANQLAEHTEAYYWIVALARQLKKLQAEIGWTMPWLNLSETPEKFATLSIFKTAPTLEQLGEIDVRTEEEILSLPLLGKTQQDETWLVQLRESLTLASRYAREQMDNLKKLAEQSYGYADMEYDFLYDKAQHLLAIGYNAEINRCDTSYYDLLASEARLSSFVAIAQGKIPQDNWFALGRRLTTAGLTPMLLSWSGSMFEYLMPMLVMPSYVNTLLDETMRGTVKRQIEYGKQHNIPWGISESCYNVVDSQLIYQYRAFGVPGLGFKRGLGEDLVIAPYATVMALMVDPDASTQNLDRLREEGFEGRYGFYESADYTPTRLPRGQSRVLIQTFMAHHQGMGFLSLAYLLLDKPMQRRFEADPQFQTVLLLLQERVPQTISFYSAATEMQDITPTPATTEMRVINTSDTVTPEVQLLSNGRLHVMVSNSGGGYTRWRDTAVTRWREDATLDNWGSFCYLRDLDSGEFWSTSHQPTLKEADHYAAVFSQGRVEFRRQDNQIETHTEIIVSPEDDIEIRRVHLVNRSRKKRRIEITSYGEVVLNGQQADMAHPAFSNLFVQTEVLSQQYAILGTRRPRSHDEQPPYMMHMMKLQGHHVEQVSYETDRSIFVGRGNTLANPAAMRRSTSLTGSQGSVLDPIVSIQYRITLEPEDTVAVDIITGMAKNREECQGLIDRYQDPYLRDRAFELSWTHSQVVLRQINATEGDAQLFGRLAGSVIYSNTALRAKQNVLLRNQRGQSALWSYSISGDLPIVLVRVADSSNLTLARQMVQAHAYWQLKGLSVDLVIVNEDHTGYRQVLQDQIHGLIAAGVGINSAGKQGGIYIRSSDQIPGEDWILFQTMARVIISDSRGSLLDQINKRPTAKPMPLLEPVLLASTSQQVVKMPENLLFFNGYGGFTQDGREYILYTSPDTITPLPWSNVIANKSFGTITTESGPSYTWAENAHAYRLTPWHNDPVSGRTGEAVFIRDEETGQFWSPMPAPVHGRGSYITRHGFGYTVYEHLANGIRSEVWVYVDVEATIKFTTIKLKNISGRARRITVTGYAEWVLADLHEKSLLHVVTEVDTPTRAILARNPYHPEFPNQVSFMDAGDETFTFTCDRTEFIGRNQSLQSPVALKYEQLSGRQGAGLDPCAAMMVTVELDNDREHEIAFRMGSAKNPFEATSLVRRFKDMKAVREALDNVHRYWRDTLGYITLETPDKALNILTNGWLPYQVLSSRLWGRSGFYQSGGAFGFRDQLQDVMALMHAKPSLTREQILLAASRQFKEGDVQHWWHPPMGRGVRTQCSDDFMWLPYVTSRYVATTGDTAILREEVSFLEGRPLNMHEESYYDLPMLSEHRATLYEHCKRAVQHGMRFGEHGLPLMGSGDWNDGMDKVGINGKGESTWLGFFFYDTLKKFESVATTQGDETFAHLCAQQASELKKNIHANAWDGEWFIRAYYDDGTPLGSSRNDECRIDSISQSWSVLSGAGEPEYSLQAMKSVDEHLVRRDAKLLQLLDPPFNRSEKDPGYIKGYVPGVRENGGQYTHAAVWMVMAFARLGDAARTWELLNMINPIKHGHTAEEIAVYKAEPYVIAADVYGVAPHTGRGGWTWYTGSAGWMYQLIIESFAGLKREGDKLSLQPCLPAEWPSVTVRYRFGDTIYVITIQHHDGDTELLVDNKRQQHDHVVLQDDKREHAVTYKTRQQEMGKLIHV